MLNPCTGSSNIVNTNTVGMSFKSFYECVEKISEPFISDKIKPSDINIRLDRDENKIPLISIQIGTDGGVYTVFTESKFLQVCPNGPLTFVLNSYKNLIDFKEKIDSYHKNTFNSMSNPINTSECVHNIDGVITHVTHFDLLVKGIDQEDKSIIIYIRSEI